MALFYLQTLLLNSDFTRTTTPTASPLIIFGTAGCGKTSIIRALASQFPELHFSSFHPIVLLPNIRKKQHLANPNEATDVLDEFLAGPNPEVRIAKFCDPLQYNCETLPEPHFISETTYRFCPRTCELLNDIFKTTLKSKVLEICKVACVDPYAVDPVGKVIAIEQELFPILSAHGLTVHSPDFLTGQTIPEVSVYTLNLKRAVAEHPHLLFIALTRHSKTLHLFDLNAGPDTTA
ncbi:triple gene block protein 1 [Potexvirus ecsalstroemeriae]|uniref:Triple gene block protein 1 n=1 Tax=Potexvirus ecsalstroemeriae TaxID=316983 RepID=Q3V6G6_9VIRU|nr:triple gene block protein 1 [Alstroemeria virus X]BAE44212.1 triple gene block protein 1 [Alstroemeria virus X]